MFLLYQIIRLESPSLKFLNLTKKCIICIPMSSIYITGIPGTGKSSIGELLGKKLNLTILEISKLILEEELFERFDNEMQTHVFDEDIVIDRLEEILNEGKEYVIVGPILPINKKFIKKVIVLFTEPRILRERLKTRNYNEKKIEENIEALLMGITIGEARDFFSDSIIIEHDTTVNTVEDSIVDIVTQI